VDDTPLLTVTITRSDYTLALRNDRSRARRAMVTTQPAVCQLAANIVRLRPKREKYFLHNIIGPSRSFVHDRSMTALGVCITPGRARSRRLIARDCSSAKFRLPSMNMPAFKVEV